MVPLGLRLAYVAKGGGRGGGGRGVGLRMPLVAADSLDCQFGKSSPLAIYFLPRPRVVCLDGLKGKTPKQNNPSLKIV